MKVSVVLRGKGMNGVGVAVEFPPFLGEKNLSFVMDYFLYY